MTRWDDERRGRVEEALRERFAALLQQGERFSVSGSGATNEAELRIVLEGGERLLLEARALGDDAEARALDTLDALLFEYLENDRRLCFEPVWREREISGRSVLVRGERTVPDLEARADALLAAASGAGAGGSLETRKDEEDDEGAQDR